jgi:hypothetical protein
MKKILPLLLMTATVCAAAEPRFQFRSFIQNDGTLMNVKLDTTTGQTWRLDRTLTNRRETTLAGKATERKLAEAMHAKIDNYENFNIADILDVIHVMNKQVMGKDFVPLVFRAPAAIRNENAHQLVPPARQFGEPPVGVDPNTGRPFPIPGQPQPNLVPGGGVRRPVPGIRPPAFPGAPGGLPGVDPATGLPLPGLGELPVPGGHAHNRFDSALIKIRNWRTPLQNISTLDLITELLNTLNAPMRCVIDENIVYFIPESATLTTRDGKTNKPKYEDRWVEIKTVKEK